MVLARSICVSFSAARAFSSAASSPPEQEHVVEGKDIGLARGLLGEHRRALSLSQGRIAEHPAVGSAKAGQVQREFEDEEVFYLAIGDVDGRNHPG